MTAATLEDYTATQVAGITAATNPRYQGVSGFLVDLDEELCNLLLQVNIDNRPLKPPNRDAIQRDLENELWELDGSPIRLDTDGFMFDGQHRALAYLRYAAKCRAQGDEPQPAPTFIIYGLKPTARETTDVNAGRSAGDNLATRKVQYAFEVAALCKQVFAYEAPGRAPGAKLQVKVTNREHDQVLAAHPEIFDLVVRTRALYSAHRAEVPGLSVKIASYGLWLFSHTDPDAGDRFMEGIWTGAVADTASPILAFRRRLLQANQQHEKLTTLDILVFLIQAWNKFLLREPASKFSRPRGKGGEPGHHTIKDVPEAINGPPRHGKAPRSVQITDTTSAAGQEVPEDAAALV